MTDSVKVLSDDEYLGPLEKAADNYIKGLKRSPRIIKELIADIPALCATVRALRDWKESALPLLNRYENLAETFGGKLGSLRVENLERGVTALREQLAEAQKSVETLSQIIFRGEQATRMRDLCLEKVRETLLPDRGGSDYDKAYSNGFGEAIDIVIEQLQSLTLEQGGAGG